MISFQFIFPPLYRSYSVISELVNGGGFDLQISARAKFSKFIPAVNTLYQILYTKY